MGHDLKWTFLLFEKIFLWGDDRDLTRNTKHTRLQPYFFTFIVTFVCTTRESNRHVTPS